MLQKLSELKTKENPTFEIGTKVWVNVLNLIWWPGTVVDPLTIPQELLDYVKNVVHITVVNFEKYNKYEEVKKLNPICLYSLYPKIELIKKGTSFFN